MTANIEKPPPKAVFSYPSVSCSLNWFVFFGHAVASNGFSGYNHTGRNLEVQYVYWLSGSNHPVLSKLALQ